MSDSLVTLWTIDCQAPLSMGFPRQEYWCGLPFASPEDLPDLGVESVSPALAGGFFTTEPAGKPSGILLSHKKEQNWVSWRDVDEPRVCHIGWSKSERENNYCILMYIYMESRKMVLMILFAELPQKHRHREWTCGHRGERRGIKWESSADIYMPPCVKQTASGTLMYSTGNSAWCSGPPRCVEWWLEGRLKGQGIPGYIWLIHQKPIQHCKPVILQ